MSKPDFALEPHMTYSLVTGAAAVGHRGCRRSRYAAKRGVRQGVNHLAAAMTGRAGALQGEEALDVTGRSLPGRSARTRP
jgi:hypothetical protein